MLEYVALESQPTSWNAVLGVGSLVLLAAGLVAMIRKQLRPGQAVAILVVAVGVAAVAAFASRFPSGLYAFAVIASTTIAGIVATVAILTRP